MFQERTHLIQKDGTESQGESAHLDQAISEGTEKFG